MSDNIDGLEDSFFRKLFVSLQGNIESIKKEIDQFKPNLIESELYLEFLRKKDEA